MPKSKRHPRKPSRAPQFLILGGLILARQYDVARAPALVLLDAAGQVVWKQDLGLSDEAPLDLEAASLQIERMLK
jgi:hypothetical protein